MKIPALLFVVISGCCAKENLHGASFVFSKYSKSEKVVLKPTVEKPLSNLTVCLQIYTDRNHKGSLFSLQDKNTRGLFHLYQIPYEVADQYYIALDRDEVFYQTTKDIMEQRVICLSWDSSSGLIHFVVNGKLFPKRVLKKGFIIGPEFTVLLGQNPARSGARAISYVGEMTEVNMWDRALRPSEMQSMYNNNCQNCSGNVINWGSVDYEIDGDIFLYKP